LLQNVSAPSATGRDQSAQVAIALADELLACKGASRIHGGGFGGTIQAFVPLDHVDWFRTRMEAVFGEGACMICGIDHEGARAEWL
ncbi:MAG: galactokinase, partial [Atopobiaceae bacterium]|nr:galactokinase [Atopobiaceae bacterium]